MTEHELSESLVKQFNLGGTVKIYPDASRLSFDEMMGEDEVTFTWFRNSGVTKYSFFQIKGRCNVIVTEDSIEIARADVEQGFLGNVVKHMQSCLRDPMAVVMSYDNKGNLIGGKEIVN